MIAAIDVGLLLELVWAAALAAIAAAACFSLVILGSTRAGELRRDGRGAAAIVYGTLAVVGAVAIAGMVVFGISVIVSK